MSTENDEVIPSLRDSLMASIETAEAPQEVQQEEARADDRARDEQGRFAPKAQEEAPVEVQQPAEEATKPSLTTWRKEMLPLHEKLATGQPLTSEEAKKLADYNVQREREYSTGISTYKSEAVKAKELQDALAEFMPTLQQHNIAPTQWIQNLGRAHSTLAMGTPEQKLQMFAKLAQDYGVPLPAVTQAQQGQLDPTVAALMAEINNLKQGVNHFTTWQQQQEIQAIQKELAKFGDAEQYPYFEQVRETMIQLLESGFAQDPDSAYVKAVRLNDQAWQSEQARQANAQEAKRNASNAAAVAKAKASAGSLKSSTPGTISKPAQATDRRAALMEQFESIGSGRV